MTARRHRRQPCEVVPAGCPRIAHALVNPVAAEPAKVSKRHLKLDIKAAKDGTQTPQND